MLLIKMNRSFKTYFRLSDYIADFPIISNLKLEDISFVFKTYFAFLSIVTLAYLLHHSTVRLLSFATFAYRSNRVATILRTS